MGTQIQAACQVVRLAIEDKVFKVIQKGTELLEALTISDLLESDHGFTVFTHSLIDSDLLFILCCRAEDNQKKIREKSLDALMTIA
mmetsp:Transcript_27614/g.60810  ORF Transcript_27614/g.60810 Transcript_27614/m.60810 type:complete len:86 (+) Transcript_27614:2007-2264(+)